MPSVSWICASEWTKLRSVRSSAWAVMCILGATVGIGAFLCAVGSTDATQAGQGDDDVVVNSLRGIYFAQFATAVFAVLPMGSEYGTGLIRATLTAVPWRHALLGVKAALLAGVVLVMGLSASVTAFLVGQPLLHRGGFVAPAYPLVSLTDGAAFRAVFGAALFLTAVAMLAFGVAVILRSTAGAISVVVALLLLPPIVASFLPASPGDLVLRSAPSAGLAVLSTVEVARSMPVGPWAGLGVTSAWAAAALLVAFPIFHRRDV
jgi:ABC-2 type transport system permease protein